MPAKSIIGTAVAVLISCLAANAQPADLYFPSEGSWRKAVPEKVGWNSDKLNETLDFAMSRKSSSVVILLNGQILGERHTLDLKASDRFTNMVAGKTNAGHSIEDVASCQKSIVSFLVGVAVEKGHLSLDDAVHKHLKVGWSAADPEQESKITLRHLMTMTSGLNARLKFQAEPGTKWQYNTAAYSMVLRCLEAATDRTANELTREWISKNIGMSDSKWAPRPWAAGREDQANTVGFTTSARDLARFGLLVLAEGNWNGKTLLKDPEYLRTALSSSQELNPSYGYLWWLNGKAATVRSNRKVEAPLLAAAPDDMVAALGALGRKCYVVPALGLVVTRLGDDPNAGFGSTKFDGEFWRLLMLARIE